MYLKLALRNIRRSVRDYAIYFITLLFGVAIFYAFNSVEGQQVLFDLQSQATEQQFATTTRFLAMFSGVIAFVLGFLILYANRFLIKRRKHEFGTYLVLGMSTSQVSRIVLYETVLIGVASLACGLLFGIFLSQGMSFLTALLFDTTISNYQFVFSADAFVQTLACFAGIYLIVTLFNTLSVTHYKLIDLLRAGSKNERSLVRNPWACLIGFVASIAILGFAYYELDANGLVMLDQPEFAIATVGMLVGSLLFFWSLAGFAIPLLMRMRGLYLRGLSMFTVRQIASQVNTAFLSLWIVCVLLFFSITVFSSGMGLVDVFVGGIDRANPYSATLTAHIWYGPDGSRASSSGDPLERRSEMQEGAPERLAQAESYDWDMARALEEAAPDLWAETIGDSAQIDFYSVPDVPFALLIEGAETAGFEPGEGAIGLDDIERMRDQEIVVMSLSDLNGVRALQGLDSIELPAGSAAIVNNMDVSKALAEAVARSQVTVDMLGEDITFLDEVIEVQLEDNAMAASGLQIVVPDGIVEAVRAAGVIPDLSLLDVMYADNGKSEEDNGIALAEIVAALQPRDMGGFDMGTAGALEPYASLLWPVTRIVTAYGMIVQSSGMRLMVTYLALYIGFIFLISTAAILAIQQLSQASDSGLRYRALWKLGCDQRMLSRSLLIQVLVYFLLPLGLASCHCACALSVMARTLFDALGVSVVEPIAFAAILVVVVYGGYLAVTYLCAKGMMRSALLER